MPTLEERISALEAEIEGYRVNLCAATTLEEKKMYANLINGARTQLHDLYLLQQQQSQQQQQGELFSLRACQLDIAALKLILSLGSPLISSPSRSRLSVI